jgi:transcriptional regulator with XRE-family HTH domain
MLTSEQILGARAMLRLEQDDVALRSGVSPETIKRLERRPGPIPASETAESLRSALMSEGVEFIPAGVRLTGGRSSSTENNGNNQWRSQMSLRQTAIEVMETQSGRPAEEVILLIAEKLQRPRSYAKAMYNWIVEHGLAPGELRVGRVVYSSKYKAPRDYSDALKMLREHLASDASDPGDIDQLMRDCSNFDAIGDVANGRTVDSKTLKQHNTLVSKGAHEFMSQCTSFEQWHEATINEHSTPINVMRDWIKQRLHSITDEEIMKYFRDNPVCSILKYPEDKLLREHPLGYHASGTIERRYPAAGIELVRLPKKPIYRKWR